MPCHGHQACPGPPGQDGLDARGRTSFCGIPPSLLRCRRRRGHWDRTPAPARAVWRRPGKSARAQLRRRVACRPRSRAVSRTQLSRIVGLALPALSYITGALIDAGLLSECAPIKNARLTGRRAVPLDIVAGARCVVAVRIGVTALVVGLVDLRARVLCQTIVQLDDGVLH